MEDENDHDGVAQRDNPKAQSTKNTRDGSAKKATVQRKRNRVAEKINDAQIQDIATPVVGITDVQENEETETARVVKSNQKRKVAEKAVAREKIEAKGRQKKGQTAVVTSVDEKKAVNNATVENDAVKEIDRIISEEMSKNDFKNILLSSSRNIPRVEAEKEKANKNEFAEPVENVKLIKTAFNEADTLVEEEN